MSMPVPNGDRREHDAARMRTDDSTIGTTRVNGSAPPHFFAAGTILVVLLTSADALTITVEQTILSLPKVQRPFRGGKPARTIFRHRYGVGTVRSRRVERVDSGNVTEPRQPAKTRQSTLSTVLIFAALAVALVAAIQAYLQRQDSDNLPPRPTSLAGQQIYIDVIEALQRQDLEVRVARSTVRSPILTEPGQGAVVDDAPIYIFVYDSPANREDETRRAELDPNAVLPATNPFGTPAASGDVHISAGSNILVALVGGSPETIEKVDRAIAGLT